MSRDFDGDYDEKVQRSVTLKELARIKEITDVLGQLDSLKVHDLSAQVVDVNDKQYAEIWLEPETGDWLVDFGRWRG